MLKYTRNGEVKFIQPHKLNQIAAVEKAGFVLEEAKIAEAPKAEKKGKKNV